jgi:hypothetical protein
MILKLFAVWASIGVVALASARVGTISTDQLAEASELIVTAKVDKLFERANVTIASATVLTVIKGTQTSKTVEFVACRTWKCDTSAAISGETVLLFLKPFLARKGRIMLSQDLDQARKLSKAKGQTLFEIAHSGRGRVPLIEKQGRLVTMLSRYDAASEWQLSVNHALPKGCRMHLTGKNQGVVALSDLLQVVKRSVSSSKLDPQRPGKSKVTV